MKLDFTNLPLVEVQIQILFREPLVMEFDAMSRVRESTQKLLPEVAVNSGASSVTELPGGIKFSFGATSLLANFADRSRGLTASLQLNAIQVVWQHAASPDGAPAYPRYAALREICEALLSAALSGPNEQKLPALANMTYVNFIRESGPSTSDTIRRHLNPGMLPAHLQSASLFHDLNLSYRLENGGDVRLQVSEANSDGESGYVFISSGGLMVDPNQPPLSTLDKVHDFLQHFFLDSISDEARSEWGLTSYASL